MSKATDILIQAIENSSISLPTGRQTLADQLAELADVTPATGKKYVTECIKKGLLLVNDEGIVRSADEQDNDTLAGEDDEDLLGEDEIADDEEAIEDLQDAIAEEHEVGDEWEIESGKHAGHTWRHTASGGYCVTCDQAIKEFWDNVKKNLEELGKSYEDLRKAAKDAGEKIIAFAKLVEATGTYPGAEDEEA